MAEDGGHLLNIDASSLERAAADIERGAKDLAKTQRGVYREISQKVSGWARFDAASGSRRERRFASAITARPTTAAARVGIRPTPGAQATFWGAKRRTGWYARERYAGSTGRQHPPWVGASWDAGKRGEGPYVLNETVADHRDEIDQMVLAAPMEVFRRATGGGRF